MVEGVKDSGSVVKIFRDMGLFLQRFQVSPFSFHRGLIVIPFITATSHPEYQCAHPKHQCTHPEHQSINSAGWTSVLLFHSLD